MAVTLPQHIDNGLPAFGEWTNYVHAGAATVEQTAEAAHGMGVGLKVVQPDSQMAYVELDAMAIPVPAGGDFWVAFWFRQISFHQTSSGIYPCKVNFGTNPGDLRAFMCGDGDAENKRKLLLACFDDLGGTHSTGWCALSKTFWQHFAFRVHRAATNVSSDGYIEVWVNGEKVGEATGIDNFDRMANATVLQMGDMAALAGVELHIDEVLMCSDQPVIEVANRTARFDPPTHRGGVKRFARHPL